MSQPNEIVLAVDEAANDTLVNCTYTNYHRYENRSVYISEDHTPLLRDTMTLYRSTPKSNGNFPGVSKTAVKFSKDVEVTGLDGVTTVKSPIIFEVSASIPLGATAADVLIAQQRIVAIMDMSTVIQPLNVNRLI